MRPMVQTYVPYCLGCHETSAISAHFGEPSRFARSPSPSRAAFLACSCSVASSARRCACWIAPEGVAGYACLNAWGVKEQIEKEKKKNFTPSWLGDLFSGMSQTKGPLNSSLTQICRHAGFPGSRHLFISKQRSKFQHHQQGRIPPFGWFCREIKFGRSQFVGIPKKGNNTPPNRVPRNPTSGTTQSIRGAAIHGRKAVRVRGVCVWMESET